MVAVGVLDCKCVLGVAAAAALADMVAEQFVLRSLLKRPDCGKTVEVPPLLFI